MRRISLPFAFAALAAAVPAQSWVKMNPTTSPSMRRTGGMSYDTTGATPRILIQGGLTQTPGTILSDTWTYNGTTWAVVGTAGGPARWGHSIVRIPSTPSRLLTFGGRSPTISGFANDTWQWNGSVWTLVSTPTAPSARFRYGMTYDTIRNVVVLFGGETSTAVVNDTWEFNGVTWAQVATTNSPPPREDMVLVFDPDLKRTVLFGGYDSATDTLYGDTWELVDGDWAQVTTASSPPPLFRMCGIHDSTRRRLVVYGGFDGVNFSTVTWEYTGSAWNQISVGAGSPYATEQYAAYDAQRKKFVAFGGVGPAFSNETWEFTGANSPIVSTYGEGCPTSVGLAASSVGTPPLINNTFTLNWTNLPLTSGAVLAITGVQQVNPPVDLTVIGYSGCGLLATPDFLSVALTTNGAAQTTFALPNQASLLFVPFYTQILIPDDQAPNAAGGMSHGVRAIIGQ